MKDGEKDNSGILSITLDNMNINFRKEFLTAVSSYQENNLLTLIKNGISAANKLDNKSVVTCLLSIVIANSLQQNKSYSNDIKQEYNVTQSQIDKAIIVCTKRFPGLGNVESQSRNRSRQISNERINALVAILETQTKQSQANYLLRSKEVKKSSIHNKYI